MSDSERMATTLELQESVWGPERRSPAAAMENGHQRLADPIQ